jgi:hypothetical protein
MTRFLSSVLVGLVLGGALGLYLGWVAFPVEFVDSAAPALAQRYKDQYTVMVANGYLVDCDVTGAVERLRLLEEPNIPDFVRNTTERYISSSRDADDIFALVALSAGLDRLTSIMTPYYGLNAPESCS